MNAKLLHVRDKLEFIIRFMMAGDGSFKARLSEAYRHPKYGLRQIPAVFLPMDLQKEFNDLLNNIDTNEHSRMSNEMKMSLMDEIFIFYKKVCDRIFKDHLYKAQEQNIQQSSAILVEQQDVITKTKEEFKLKTPTKNHQMKKSKR